MEFRMSCVRYLGLAALVTAAFSTLPALANEASTIRIEPRSFYGAVVTVEEGVRVFRPLPPHKHVVINPDNATSVGLNISEEVRKNYNYHYGEDRVVGHDGGFDGFAAPGLPFGFDDKRRMGKKRDRVGPFNPEVEPRDYKRRD
jgi:hypothetical protein